jgi:hypothetical protein
MFGIKKQFIKNYIGLRIIENTEGRLVIGSPRLGKIEEKYMQFAKYIERYLMMVGGIYSIQVDYDSGEVVIAYDEGMLQNRQLIGWIDFIYDMLIDHLQEIEKYWETNPENLDNKFTTILEQKLSNFR